MKLKEWLILFELKGKYMTALLLVATISTVTIGAVLSYNLSMPEDTKTLSLPDITANNEIKLSNPSVTSIRTLEDDTKTVQGCFGNKIVYWHLGEEPEKGDFTGTTLYNLDSDEENLIYSGNKILRNSGTVGMYSISQDKAKIILSDKDSYSSELGEAFGVYVYDINNENTVKIADISKELNVPTTKSLGERSYMTYTTYNGGGWSVDGESVIYCIKNTDKNIFDFFIYNLKTCSTEKHSLKNSKTNFMRISMPKLSADGRYIYFTGYFEDSPLMGSLYRIDLTQKNKKAEWLTDYATYYHLSDDGRRIIFTDALIESPKRNIYMLDTLTKEEKVIIENPFCLFDISADGNKIAYTIKNENSIEVRIAYLKNDGIANSTTIYASGHNESTDMAFWNHDGSKIITQGDFGKSYVIELDYVD